MGSGLFTSYRAESHFDLLLPIHSVTVPLARASEEFDPSSAVEMIRRISYGRDYTFSRERKRESYTYRLKLESSDSTGPEVISLALGHSTVVKDNPLSEGLLTCHDLVVPRNRNLGLIGESAPPVKNGINKSSRVWDLVVQIYSASTPILIIDRKVFVAESNFKLLSLPQFFLFRRDDEPLRTANELKSGSFVRKRSRRLNQVRDVRSCFLFCLYPYEFASFRFLCESLNVLGEQTSKGCLRAPRIRYAFDLYNDDRTHHDVDWFEYVRNIGVLMPTCESLGVPAITGRLGCSMAGAGKRRIFAIGNYVNQRLLRPVHEWLAEILRRIPMDGTFNQTAPLDRLRGSRCLFVRNAIRIPLSKEELIKKSSFLRERRRKSINKTGKKMIPASSIVALCMLADPSKPAFLARDRTNSHSLREERETKASSHLAHWHRVVSTGTLSFLIRLFYGMGSCLRDLSPSYRYCFRSRTLLRKGKALKDLEEGPFPSRPIVVRWRCQLTGSFSFGGHFLCTTAEHSSDKVGILARASANGMLICSFRNIDIKKALKLLFIALLWLDSLGIWNGWHTLLILKPYFPLPPSMLAWKEVRILPLNQTIAHRPAIHPESEVLLLGLKTTYFDSIAADPTLHPASIFIGSPEPTYSESAGESDGTEGSSEGEADSEGGEALLRNLVIILLELTLASTL
ncbi:hypothetical protein ZIOFF_074349 (mitochondrion) [Zingiber officinale]|uniref:Uncharacterized protein n=1 Tax=Zingiber officinale TaxID=94328 RepID=A0A8J5C2A6_ZINOF|nr:hypothetical protein ZIOFF_074349 [Zingiber officinale]